MNKNKCRVHHFGLGSSSYILIISQAHYIIFFLNTLLLRYIEKCNLKTIFSQFFTHGYFFHMLVSINYCLALNSWMSTFVMIRISLSMVSSSCISFETKISTSSINFDFSLPLIFFKNCLWGYRGWNCMQSVMSNLFCIFMITKWQIFLGFLTRWRTFHTLILELFLSEWSLFHDIATYSSLPCCCFFYHHNHWKTPTM